MRVWEYETVDQYGKCRRMHAECLSWITSGM